MLCLFSSSSCEAAVGPNPPKVLTSYLGLTDNILHRMRFPKFLSIVRDELGEEVCSIRSEDHLLLIVWFTWAIFLHCSNHIYVINQSVLSKWGNNRVDWFLDTAKRMRNVGHMKLHAGYSNDIFHDLGHKRCRQRLCWKGCWNTGGWLWSKSSNGLLQELEKVLHELYLHQMFSPKAQRIFETISKTNNLIVSISLNLSHFINNSLVSIEPVKVVIVS